MHIQYLKYTCTVYLIMHNCHTVYCICFNRQVLRGDERDSCVAVSIAKAREAKCRWPEMASLLKEHHQEQQATRHPDPSSIPLTPNVVITGRGKLTFYSSSFIDVFFFFLSNLFL